MCTVCISTQPKGTDHEPHRTEQGGRRQHYAAFDREDKRVTLRWSTATGDQPSFSGSTLRAVEAAIAQRLKKLAELPASQAPAL